MDVILWKTILFNKLKVVFLYTYWISSSGITKKYILTKYLWSPCSTDETQFAFVFCFLLGVFFSDHKHLVSHVFTFESMIVCQIREFWFAKTQRHFMSDIFFFLGSVWQILYFIKTKLPVNIKGNAKRNNPLQDIVLLYLIFAKYITRIFLLIW